ncbi:hypothetical protein BDV93DRAFT_133586 [Ceratobasidium sp. AG-I]|nr:hypothetical protein BDV93DRAFT_133586 [Ceratobasidium sp. AG-I]
MQSIIGYSDDDRSDDELKRPKTLSTTKPKDGLQPRKAVAAVATKLPNVVATSPIPNHEQQNSKRVPTYL